MIDKKELKKQYKQTIQPMGIYQIKNLVNEKIFVGSAKNLKAQTNSNKFQLNAGIFYINKELQKDYTELGEGKFSFEVMDYLEPKKELDYDYTKDLAVLEEIWLDKLQPYDDRGYNKRKVSKN